MYKKTHKQSNTLVNNSGSITKIDANNNDANNNESVVQIFSDDSERIDHLKLAIDKGRYTIDSLRVAEKFIQFESQLGI